MPDAPDERDDDLPDGQLQLTNLTETASGDMATVYTRESSESVEGLLTHTETTLGYSYEDASRERLVGLSKSERTVGINSEHGYDGVAVIYDDDESHPTGVEHLIEFVSERDVDDAVAASLAEFGGVDAATRTVERLQDEGVTVHLTEDEVTVEPDDGHARKLFAAARRASRVDTDAGSQLVTEAAGSVEWTGGQPPAGFTVGANGYLQRDEETWETIRRAAAAVEQDAMSEYRASQLTGISRHAIRTALNEYRDAYRVEEADPLTINDAEQ